MENKVKIETTMYFRNEEYSVVKSFIEGYCIEVGDVFENMTFVLDESKHIYFFT